MIIIKNKYKAICSVCKASVSVGDGFVVTVDNKNWLGRCKIHKPKDTLKFPKANLKFNTKRKKHEPQDVREVGFAKPPANDWKWYR